MNDDYFCMHWHFFPIIELTAILLSSKGFHSNIAITLSGYLVCRYWRGSNYNTQPKTKTHGFNHVGRGSGTSFEFRLKHLLITATRPC